MSISENDAHIHNGYIFETPGKFSPYEFYIEIELGQKIPIQKIKFTLNIGKLLYIIDKINVAIDC